MYLGLYTRTEKDDDPGRIRKKRRGFSPAVARKMARSDRTGPHFVCQECKTAFVLSYMKYDPGTLTRSERNLCRDCYKAEGLT